ncbi:phytoene synthase [Sphingomonas jejuensis]|uniref:Phytoene synthase n=1 Tax=Sphingomonas jejuensis TaxID=904715 RepID=A0ABX0XQN4_9SPHN|nr:phytoene synthase [Sphingomonas jejuensis]
MTRAELVAQAGATISRGSKSFRFASRLFDRTTRERAWLLYAWCRTCDDIADAQELGGMLGQRSDPKEAQARLEALTARALAGETTGEPAFDGLGQLSREIDLPRRFVDDHLAGFALDAEDWRPRTEADMIRYCYHVAGAVGGLMAAVMGVPADDENTLARAVDLGLAFQLSNIARDLMEDAAADRIYLPVDWLVEMDMPPGELAKPFVRPRLAALARRLNDLSEGYTASAKQGATRLPFRARWAVLAAAGIYGEIGREVVRRGDHAWDSRVVVPRGRKLVLVWQALMEARAMGSGSIRPWALAARRARRWLPER